MTDRFLEGRTAWVTDGVTALGHSIVLALADAGANVAVSSFVSPDRALRLLPADAPPNVAQELRDRGTASFESELDLRTGVDVDRFYHAAVATLGPVDILVNSASVRAREDMHGHRTDVWNAVLDVNLHGSYRTIKRCMASMLERRFGRIINIASPAANVGYVGHSAYCASMSALMGLTRCVALEGAEFGLTCNAVHPGWLETGTASKTLRHVDLEVMPQRRFIPPKEVASLVVFLCRHEALGITGEALSVTGGAVPVAEPG